MLAIHFPAIRYQGISISAGRQAAGGGKVRVPAHSTLIFDKAYNYYRQFVKWTEESIYFVSRQKSNAVYSVVKRVSRQQDNPLLPK